MTCILIFSISSNRTRFPATQLSICNEALFSHYTGPDPTVLEVELEFTQNSNETTVKDLNIPW